MCINNPVEIDSHNIILFKVFDKTKDGYYHPIFYAAIEEDYEIGKVYEASSIEWDNYIYPASFHALKLIDANNILYDILHNKKWNVITFTNPVICKVELSGKIYKGYMVYDIPTYAGTHMKIIEECTREDL